MIKKIIAIADVHIPNKEENRPYSQILKKSIAEIYKHIKDYSQDEFRIVVVGDIFQNKIRTSNEAKETFHMMLNYLNAIGKTYIIAGNHDMLENNLDRLDSISPTFGIKDVYPNISYLDKELNYESGCLVDNNITFALFSIFDNFRCPSDISSIKDEYPDNKIIGLYHGDIVGTVTDMGRISDYGVDERNFKDCDCVIAGHIHKFQEINKKGVPIVYCGSLIQQNSGENIVGHGFVEFDTETLDYKRFDIDNEYKIYHFKISSYEDIQNNNERLING